MLENYNAYKILKIFLDNPTEEFRLRELSRMSKISPPSVMEYLRYLQEKGFLRRFSKRDIPFYKALRDNNEFIVMKKISIIYELNFSGLVDFLWEELSPDAIILYGSYAKGESVEDSDVDIFVIGKEKDINLTKFEKKLNKKVHLMFEDNVNKISKELKNNLINGIVLRGYLKVLK